MWAVFATALLAFSAGVITGIWVVFSQSAVDDR